MFAANQSAAPNGGLFIEDVFLVNTRSGTGGTTTVTGGPDMSTKGGLHITKSRSTTTGWRFTDTLRGATFSLDSSSTAAQVTESTGLTAFTTSGATFGADANYNASGQTFVDFFLRRAPKFFDVVTWTGDGAANRLVTHALGQSVGMAIVKRTDSATNWFVWHQSLPTQGGNLNLTNAFTSGQNPMNSAPTSTHLDMLSGLNISGATYVAYLFAHDSSADGLIQCGSFTTDASGNASVTLGWEPQFGTFKVSSTTGNWRMLDAMRGFALTNSKELNANDSSAEGSYTPNFIPTATGFTVSGTNASATFIYLAIRRGPMRKPTSGTQVYNAIARTGTGAVKQATGVGFSPDLAVLGLRTSANGTGGPHWYDRMRGAGQYLASSGTAAEVAQTDTLTAFGMDGVTYGADASNVRVNYNSGQTLIDWFFRRYPGVFDIVAYTGTGAARTVAHNLGVAPELMIVKRRDSAAGWGVYCKDHTKTLLLNTTDAQVSAGVGSSGDWGGVAPTATAFSVGASGSNFAVNTAGATFVAYLFATLAGISKVGSYVGNGTSQTIDCGFAAGARFVLIKTATGGNNPWFVFDTVRGIVAAADPYLLLNSTAAEATTGDEVDPAPSGFIVNNTGNALNASGNTYIYLAFA